MTQPRPSPQFGVQALEAMSSFLGLDMSAARLDELHPQVRRAAGSIPDLYSLDMRGLDPAIAFRAARD